MPISFDIDHRELLVTARAEGDVTSQELQNVLGEIIAAQAMPYRKLFDVSGGRMPNTARMDEVAATVRLYASMRLGPLGPVAVVIAPGKEFPVAKSFVLNAPADRPVHFFEDAAEARRWLDNVV